MTRRRIGTALTVVAALAFFATAGIHSTGYSSVTALTADASPDLAALVPALWLAFSMDLVVVGLIVGVVAFGTVRGGRPILFCAALNPLGAAGLQVYYLGFIPPTAVLLTVATLTLAAAAVGSPQRTKAEA